MRADVEQWVLRAMERWPNVPALFGWLGLDRRGRWLIKGEVISRPQIIETINRNYAVDEHGRWFFQNGPQRGYIELGYAPFVLLAHGDALVTHTELPVEQPLQVFLDEEGTLLVLTEHGAGVIVDTDLDWALNRLSSAGRTLDDEQLARALSLPSGESTQLWLTISGSRLPVIRLDSTAAPALLHFVRHPRPRQNEVTSSRVVD